MAYIIANNLFTRDIRGDRGVRLSFIAGNIDSVAAELKIEAALLDWGRGASAIYDAAIINQTNKIGEKETAFQASQTADAAMLVRYMQLRKLLKPRYGGDKLTLREFGIAGPIPKSNRQKYYKATELIEKNAERLAAGDPKALPAAMVQSLVSLVADADSAHKAALEAGRTAKQSTDTLKALFAADSLQLRILYNWCVSYWGKQNPMLIELGFVKARTYHRGQPKAPQNLSYDNITSVFGWDAVERATSYQCEMKNANLLGADSSGANSSGANSLGANSLGANLLGAEWNEIYEGAETSFIWPKVEGRWKVRVRARNVHGFGKWGDEIEI